ncbi:hypothetical protein BH09BAC3_BH09BAC3_20720 [soil metagenome]
MARLFLVFVGLLLLIGACTQRLACPAYQSAFIYDKDALKQKFSYFKEDSTPKMLTASKSKYLIAVPESYRKKYRKMQTIEMKPIYPKKPEDSVKMADEFALAEVDEADSVKLDSAAVGKSLTAGDSTYAITKTKEKYNLDQDLYMWYFREMLVLPDVRAAMESNSEKKKEEASGGKGVKKEKVGFFKGLKNMFKKKEKTDSLGNPIETKLKPKETDINSPVPEKKKKGGLFKKKDKPPVEEVPKKETPKKKDDGFE